MIWSVTFDHLPETAAVDGIVYPINFGYRAMMAIEIEMFGENNDEQKLLNTLNIFYFQNIPLDWQKAIDYMLWFHRCGREEKKRGGGGLAKDKRAYCFSQDAPLIYAAFMQQYQVNLRKTSNKELHWWEFSAMLESLNEDTKMAKVMYWRTCDLNDLPKSQKKFIKKMKELYALKETESSLDCKAKLAKRNTDMKEYIRKRMEECGK